jgi:hypothetical protein
MIAGTVGRDVKCSSTTLVISGDVGRDVAATANSVTVTSQGKVAGDLNYWSTQAANVAGTVTGETIQHQPTPQQQPKGPLGTTGVLAAVLGAAVAWFESLLAIVVLGLVLVWLARNQMRTTSQAVANRLGLSLGVGALAFFVTPPIALTIFGLGLFIGLWWLAFVLGAVFWLLMLAGSIVGSLAVGRAILRRATAAGEPALAWSMLLGLALVWLVGAVPFVGWLAWFGVMLVGTGAIVLVAMGKGEKPALAEPVAQAVPPMTPTAPPPPPIQPSTG